MKHVRLHDEVRKDPPGAAPIGREVSLYYDGCQQLEPDNCLQTPTGRTYYITHVRVQTRGQHRGRQHLRAVVVEKPPEGSKVHPIYWYPRKRRKIAS